MVPKNRNIRLAIEMTGLVFRDAFPMMGSDFHSALKHSNHQALGAWEPGVLMDHHSGPWMRPAAPDHHSGAKRLHNLTGVNFVTLALKS